MNVVEAYRRLVFPILKQIDAERAHHLALDVLRLTGPLPIGSWAQSALAGAATHDPRLRVDCLGLSFTNPLGIAAGLDKDAEAVAGLLGLGFGAVEAGTVTPLPQPGNPTPRLWRFPDDAALINALGFPSQGVAAVRERLAGQAFPGIVGINLGKNKTTPPEQAATDYASVLETLWDVADYAVINVSSPNTPGLRDLQQRGALTAILRQVNVVNKRSSLIHGRPAVPLLVKIAPDLDDAGVLDVVETSLGEGASGLIVCNTTIDHSGLRVPRPDLPGGLSGAPLRQQATTLVRRVREIAGPDPVIIGVGGIATAADVIERMQAGANLVQLYTGFIYGGPGLPGRIARDLLAQAEREGLANISELTNSQPD